jgi:hypothetical protein
MSDTQEVSDIKEDCEEFILAFCATPMSDTCTVSDISKTQVFAL